MILRLAAAPGTNAVACRLVVHRSVTTATRCDVRERDLGPLGVTPTDDGAVVELQGAAIESVRLVLGADGGR